MSLSKILKILFWRNSGCSETVSLKDGNDYTYWTENHYLVEETVKKLITDDDVCEVHVVNGFNMLVFCWDWEHGIIITSKLLEVA